MANRRAEYQRLCEELRVSEDSKLKEELKRTIRGLILEDDSYAEGFIEDSLRRTLKYISPTVGKDEGRPFALAAEIYYDGDEPSVLLGASFLPKIGDDLDHLIDYLGEEIKGLARMKGLDWLILELAINGQSIPRD